MFEKLVNTLCRACEDGVLDDMTRRKDVPYMGAERDVVVCTVSTDFHGRINIELVFTGILKAETRISMTLFLFDMEWWKGAWRSVLGFRVMNLLNH